MDRINESQMADPLVGSVRWSPTKSLWYLFHGVVGLWGSVAFFSFSGLVIFVGSTGFILCLGHSLGFHRRLIHKSYACSRLLEHFLVYFGVLVGMAGPFGIIRTHDLRDWAQRQKECHSYLRHGEGILHDG